MDISIIGCGWLGLPLGKRLVKDAHTVRGSTRTLEKFDQIRAAGILPYQLDLQAERWLGDMAPLLQSEVLILNLPPGRKQPGKNDYLQRLRFVLDRLAQADIQKLLFIGSLSVFGTMAGSIDEKSPYSPERGSGKALQAVEEYLAQLPVSVSVLRLGGLIGPGRQPGRFLAGKTGLEKGQAPVNLVHLDDVIGIIQAILAQGAWGEVFHGVAEEHPSRAEYYTAAAHHLGLEVPEFVPDTPNPRYKIASNHKVKTALGYRFLMPDPRAIFASGST